jgi:hypothetical protein
MVSRDYYYMEVFEPRNFWILELGYEVTKVEITGLVEILLSNLRNPKVDRFDTYEEKSSK